MSPACAVCWRSHRRKGGGLVPLGVGLSTNYELLETALDAKVAELTDDIAKYKGYILVDQYIAALQQQANATATDITSYSIGGRSVTRAGSQDYAAIVSDLEAQLNRLLYGGRTLADFRRLIDTENYSL